MQRHLSSLTTIFAALISNAALAAPDVIVVNGDVYTVDFAAPRVEAFAVEDGRFTAVGRNADIRNMAGVNTRIIDAGGNTVLPGLIDGHAHVSGNAPAVAGVDLSYVVEKDDWLQLIEEADARMPEGEWMTGGYWDHTLSDAKFPTKELLDEVVPDRPIFLNHIDGHYAWVNSLALDLAEVTADTRVPPGGEIVVDKDTGEPTGILLETAMGVVRGIIPERSEVQRRQGLAEMYQIANSVGITGLHQMGGLEDYLYIVEQGDPTMRVWYGQRGPTGAVAAYDEHVQQILDLQAKTKQRVSDTGKQETSGPLLHVGYVKLMNDGVLSAHTAVLLESYRDREGWMGEYITEPIDLATQVDEITRAGLPVAIHSIGDAAVRASLAGR